MFCSADLAILTSPTQMLQIPKQFEFSSYYFLLLAELITFWYNKKIYIECETEFPTVVFFRTVRETRVDV